MFRLGVQLADVSKRAKPVSGFSQENGMTAAVEAPASVL
jgi:hypothetical protein